MKPKVITLCGLTRFRRAFEEWNVRLTVDEGAVVLSIVIPSHSYGLSLSEREETAFDAAHLAKIDLCDEIFMLDIGGYIGDSARRAGLWGLKRQENPLSFARASQLDRGRLPLFARNQPWRLARCGKISS